MDINVENPFRPVYEIYAIATWFGAAVLMGVSAVLSNYPTTPFLAFAAFALFMAARMVPKTLELYRRHKRLKGTPLSFMTREELKEICATKPDHIFLGYGYNWTQTERQLVHTITRNDPSKLAPRDDGQLGQPWIHGLGEEEPIWLPIDHNAGHMLLGGTTRAGKTRIVDSLITQAVFRGEAVIILDPKGDKDLMACAKNACVAAGCPENFVYFHPAFPDKSWRIDPLKNFSRPTELATRIASLIPSETGADPFTAFGQMSMTHVINGILMVNEKPTLKDIRSYLEGGMAGLLTRAVKSYAQKTFGTGEWEEHYHRQLQGSRSDEASIAQRTAGFYRDFVRPRKASPEIEGLIAAFTHDASHYGKMIASLMPVLTMLTAGELGDLLSPDPKNLRDHRQITDFMRCIKNKMVVYVGLDSLSDKLVGSAIGSMFLADMTAVSGHRYNYGIDNQPVNLFVDEAAELANDLFVAMLNKAGGSKIRITAATQTFADFTARMGKDAKTRMALGNLNNVLALRLLDSETKDYIAESFQETFVRHVEYSQSTKGENDELFGFSGTMSESLKEEKVPFVDPPMLGVLPNLEFFAHISGGRLVKTRIPILTSAA